MLALMVFRYAGDIKPSWWVARQELTFERLYASLCMNCSILLHVYILSDMIAYPTSMTTLGNAYCTSRKKQI